MEPAYEYVFYEYLTEDKIFEYKARLKLIYMEYHEAAVKMTAINHYLDSDYKTNVMKYYENRLKAFEQKVKRYKESMICI